MPKAKQKPISPSRILIVESDLQMMRIMGDALHKAGGYVVDPVFTIKQAEVNLKLNKYDLVTTSSFIKEKMAAKNLLQMVKALKKKTPLLLVTGYPYPQEITQDFRDCDQVLKKPFRVEELVEAVQNMIK